MMRKATLLVVVLLLVIAVVPASAARPLAVDIEVEATIGPPGGGPFVATGPAVNEGLMCGDGDTLDIFAAASGPPGGDFRNLRILKTFTCDDNSGTFDIRLNVKLDLVTHETTANWRIVGGTGAYVRLHGNGKLVGLPIVPGVSITDLYSGTLH